MWIRHVVFTTLNPTSWSLAQSRLRIPPSTAQMAMCSQRFLHHPPLHRVALPPEHGCPVGDAISQHTLLLVGVMWPLLTNEQAVCLPPGTLHAFFTLIADRKKPQEEGAWVPDSPCGRFLRLGTPMEMEWWLRNNLYYFEATEKFRFTVKATNIILMSNLQGWNSTIYSGHLISVINFTLPCAPSCHLLLLTPPIEPSLFYHKFKPYPSCTNVNTTTSRNPFLRPTTGTSVSLSWALAARLLKAMIALKPVDSLLDPRSYLPSQFLRKRTPPASAMPSPFWVLNRIMPGTWLPW